MDRRCFSKSLAMGLSLLVWDAEELLGGRSPPDPHEGGGVDRRSPFPSELQVNGDRLNGWLSELARYGARADGGVDRVAFSDADLEAREWVRGIMEESGLSVRMDVAGNLIGRRAGLEPGLPPLWVGSHIDTVPAGGRFDGALGSLAAIEVARTLEESGRHTRHPLEVVVFVNEEGGKTGSRAMAGEVKPEELELATASGYSIGEGIARLGGDPARLGEAKVERGSVAGFLELHVEQGGVLERQDVSIGVVEGIVGIRRWNVTVEGSSNHAGTTPMDQRTDALVGASELVLAVNRVARSLPGSQVATVGRITARPGAPNVIPGLVEMSLEIRALDMETIEEVFQAVRREAKRVEEKRGTVASFEEFYLSAAAPTDERFRQWIEEAASAAALESHRMPSGAGHDAQAVAAFAPVGMVFVPSIGGLSHHPREYTRPEDVEAGANVLLGALLRADQGLS